MTDTKIKKIKNNKNKKIKKITTIIEGKAGRGRPRTPFMKQIIDDIGETNYNN